MNVYTIILHTALILTIVSVNIATSRRSPYNRLSYGDRSASSRQDQDPEYSAEDGARFGQHRQSSDYRYRLSRAQQESDTGQQRADYGGPNDPSIEVIVDPAQQKAVAVIENGPTGQATYDLTGYRSSNDVASGSEAEMRAADQNPAMDFDRSFADRKRDSKPLGSDGELHGNRANDAINGNSASPQKRKRSMEMTKNNRNGAGKASGAKVTQEYTENQVAGMPEKSNKAKAAESNCPPHLEAKAKQVKRNKGEVRHDKREVGNAFSQSQISALTDSLAKVKDTGADMENLRRMLYDMGLVREDRAVEESKADAQPDAAVQTKRELQQEQNGMEDEDMNEDSIVMKRADAQSSDEDGWEDDQPDKRETAAEYADEEEDAEMVEEPKAKRENGAYDASNVAASTDEERNENAAPAMRNKRQNGKALDDEEANPDENQNEMIDRYEKELRQTASAERNRREPMVGNQALNPVADALEYGQQHLEKSARKRFDKDENKLIRDAETVYHTMTSESNRLNKRENAEDGNSNKDSGMNGSEKGDAKQNVESLIKEKIEMIKEKVKREIVEENDAWKSMRAVRSVGEGSYKHSDETPPARRSKRDLTAVSVNGQLKSHEVGNYVLNRREPSNVTLAPDHSASERNPGVLPETDAKELDPNFASHNLKPYIRERREAHGNNSVLGTGFNETIRKRREATDDKQAMAAKPSTLTVTENRTLRKKRTNGVPEKQMVYEPFQNEDTDVSDEEQEFADDAKDARLYLDKRQARNEEEFQYFEEPQKRTAEQEANVEEQDVTYPDGEGYHAADRRRGSSADNARFRAGSTHEYDREKRGNGVEALEDNAGLTEDEEYSENLYFGPLSQSYDGQLTRYKRVKRDKP